MDSRVLTETIPFVPASRTLDFAAVPNFNFLKLKSVVHQDSGAILFAPFINPAYVATNITGTVVTLAVDTTAMNATDKLQIQYAVDGMSDLTRIAGKDSTGQIMELPLSTHGAVMVGNVRKLFRDNFITGSPDLAVWDQVWVSQGSSFVGRGGDTAGSSYLRIALDPVSDTEYTLTTKDSFKLPSRFLFGVSMSQRMLGQEFAIELVGVNDSDVIQSITSPADLAISGTVSVTSNVATINFAADHYLKGGDRVILFGNQDSRLNLGPLAVTVVTNRQITIPFTVTNGTYTAGGFVRWADPCGLALNASGLLYENTTANNATFTSRRNGASPRQINMTVATTAATQTNTSSYCDSFNSANANELIGSAQEFMVVSRGADNNAAPSGQNRWTQGIPDEEKEYKVRVRVKVLKNSTRPIAKVVSLNKAGSTTWTAVLDRDVSAILTANQSQVAFAGNRDTVNFPAQTTTPVLSVSTNTITFAGLTGSASSTQGGMLMLVQGGQALVGITTLAVQSIQRTNNVLSITVSAAPTGALPGEYWELYGCDATSLGLYDGPYLVLRMTSAPNVYEVKSVGADFGLINCGGAFFKRTECRIHGVAELEYTRHVVELMNQNGSADGARAIPVVITSGTITTATVTATNLSCNINQIAGQTPVMTANGTATNAAALALHVGINQASHLPVLPQHVYQNISI